MREILQRLGKEAGKLRDMPFPARRISPENLHAAGQEYLQERYENAQAILAQYIPKEYIPAVDVKFLPNYNEGPSWAGTYFGEIHGKHWISMDISLVPGDTAYNPHKNPYANVSDFTKLDQTYIQVHELIHLYHLSSVGKAHSEFSQLIEKNMTSQEADAIQTRLGFIVRLERMRDALPSHESSQATTLEGVLKEGVAWFGTMYLLTQEIEKAKNDPNKQKLLKQVRRGIAASIQSHRWIREIGLDAALRVEAARERKRANDVGLNFIEDDQYIQIRKAELEMAGQMHYYLKGSIGYELMRKIVQDKRFGISPEDPRAAAKFCEIVIKMDLEKARHIAYDTPEFQQIEDDVTNIPGLEVYKTS